MQEPENSLSATLSKTPPVDYGFTSSGSQVSASMPILERFGSQGSGSGGVKVKKEDLEIVADSEIKTSPTSGSDLTSSDVTSPETGPPLQIGKNTSETSFFTLSESRSEPFTIAEPDNEPQIDLLPHNAETDNIPSENERSEAEGRRKSVTFAPELLKSEKSSVIIPTRLLQTPEEPAKRIPKERSAFLKVPTFEPEEILCRYASCGCQEKVQKGTILEQDHYQYCNFRPIPCLLEDNCGDEVPYHDFVLHMMGHYIQPKYGLSLTSTIYLWGEDFKHDQKWYPKWLSAQGNHFFLMMQRKIPGIWVSWIWMLGTKEEAEGYEATIHYFKGLRSIGGTVGVHSIRETPEQIEIGRDCLLFTDQAMLNLSQIEDKIVTDFSINLQIGQKTMREEFGEPNGQHAIIETPPSSASLKRIPHVQSDNPTPVETEDQTDQPVLSTHELEPTTPTNSEVPDMERLFSEVISSLAPAAVEDGSDFGFGFGDEAPPSLVEEYQTAESDTLEEVLKIFASNKPLQGYDSQHSQVSTAAPGASRYGILNWNLDNEFSYGSATAVKDEDRLD